MLHERFPAGRLNSILIAGATWAPYPTVRQRRRWDRLSPAARSWVLQQAREEVARPCPDLPASLYLEFLRTGNRSHYERPYMGRRRRLTRLVLGECVENRGRFLDAVLDTAWALCEESTWCLPAHVGAQKAGSGLPDVADPVVDLFAGETASLLTWTLHLLGPHLDAVSPLLAARIRREIGLRILTPCRERNDFWWMGMTLKNVNNWTPWICSNWLTAALLLEQDPARRARDVAKAMRCIDRFVNVYPPDGGCDEGPGYWGRAGASLFDCLELLHAASGGVIDVYDEPLVQQMGRYIRRMHIAGRWFVNFADAQARLTPPEALTFRWAERIGDRALRDWARALVPASGLPRQLQDQSLPRALQALFCVDDLRRTRRVPPPPDDAWLPDLQVLVARTGPRRGFTVAAKGGHNAESHNHNDVGNVVVYRDGRPVLVDAGVGTYTRQTFSRDRYAIWTMQSQYHNLPTVNGAMQSNGPEFRAHAVRRTADDAGTCLEMDLARAYPPAAGLRNWRRRIVLERRHGVVVEDRYEAGRPVRNLVLHLLTPCRVRPGKGHVRFLSRALPAGERSGAATLTYEPGRFTVSVETIPQTDPVLAAVWGPSLSRINLALVAPGRTGTLTLRFTA